MGLSKIEWTDCTLNPIRARRKDSGKVGWHCEKVSPACTNCYASTLNQRNLPHCGTGLDYTRASRDQVEIFLDLDVLRQPLQWKKPRRIFVCSMTDLFGDFVPDDMIGEVWRLMANLQRHTYHVLTKRADRLALLIPRLVATFGVLENLQLGVTVENQDYADERIPRLLQVDAAVRFISYEPALGGIDIRRYLSRPHPNGWNNGLSWVIAGGESGAKARPPHPSWFEDVRDQCQAAGVPFFFKQWGSYVRWEPKYSANESRIRYVWPDPPKIERQNNGGAAMVNVGRKKAGRLLDGKEWSEFPKVDDA
jgi:protein gp37